MLAGIFVLRMITPNRIQEKPGLAPRSAQLSSAAHNYSRRGRRELIISVSFSQ